MSGVNLHTQIKEDYLTCPICFNSFIKPKALPCIHTFCESCLRDYVASRGFDSTGKFPCPICREECKMPSQGVEGFPNNHLMSSLSDTVDKANHDFRPVPKPRRNLGVVTERPNVNNNVMSNPPQEAECRSLNSGLCCSFGPDEFQAVDKTHTRGDCGSSVDDSAPPSYSSVADVNASCSNNDDASWMVVPRENPPEYSNDKPPSYYPNPPSFATSTLNVFSDYLSSRIGWNLQPHNNDTPSHARPNEQFAPLQPDGALYPSVPMNNFDENSACTDSLILQFGKQGSAPRDFIKPSGLAVSRDGQYVILDKAGDYNRILIFNSGGEITTAFKCGAKVQDIAITGNDDIIASIDKNASAFRMFTLQGQLKGEFGKCFTFEKLGGIAELKNKGFVITGVEGNCVYIMTPQIKLSTKFGRKGKGDGYFLHPSFVAVDSKNDIIVTDKINGNVQVFDDEGKFKLRFGSNGQSFGELKEPLGVCVDENDNIVVADSGNFRVEIFSPDGQWLCSLIKNTQQLGENVRPVNVAMTPTGKVAVLLCGSYFAEVRVYTSRVFKVVKDKPMTVRPSSIWYSN